MKNSSDNRLRTLSNLENQLSYLSTTLTERVQRQNDLATLLVRMRELLAQETEEEARLAGPTVLYVPHSLIDKFYS